MTVCYLCDDSRYERFGNGEDRPCSACNAAELEQHNAAKRGDDD